MDRSTRKDSRRAESSHRLRIGIAWQDVDKLAGFASSLTGAKLISLGDYSNSRGAADMGLYPDLLPGYQPVTEPDKFQQEWSAIPSVKGLSLPEMVEAATAGALKALYVWDRIRLGD